MQIPLVGTASIPEVSLAEGAFEFGSLTVGGCESLGVTLVNRGPIPASLQLNLSQHEEFLVEKKSVSVSVSAIPAGNGPGSGGVAGGGGGGGGNSAADDHQQGGGNSRQVSFGWSRAQKGRT